MPNEGGKYHRRSIRLPGFDYGQPGMYFVTICTCKRQILFGEVVEGAMVLNQIGRIVEEEWSKTAALRPYVALDKFVIMPNHFHAIVEMHERRGTACRAPTAERFAQPVSGSLPTIIRSFKSAVTKRVNDCRNMPGVPFWQENYYEHVIRNEDDLHRIREYIQTNPVRWEIDRENLAKHGEDEFDRWLASFTKKR
jgi:REP element-mobilizing transposase RayT